MATLLILLQTHHCTYHTFLCMFLYMFPTGFVCIDLDIIIPFTLSQWKNCCNGIEHYAKMFEENMYRGYGPLLLEGQLTLFGRDNGSCHKHRKMSARFTEREIIVQFDRQLSYSNPNACFYHILSELTPEPSTRINLTTIFMYISISQICPANITLSIKNSHRKQLASQDDFTYKCK